MKYVFAMTIDALSRYAARTRSTVTAIAGLQPCPQRDCLWTAIPPLAAQRFYCHMEQAFPRELNCLRAGQRPQQLGPGGHTLYVHPHSVAKTLTICPHPISFDNDNYPRTTRRLWLLSRV
ncbi:MAG: hypothetical protein INR62_09955 [Rhodospirillales bacterium]|nr:hypothetical protein [Acetobacter sp.]